MTGGMVLLLLTGVWFDAFLTSRASAKLVESALDFVASVSHELSHRWLYLLPFRTS